MAARKLPARHKSGPKKGQFKSGPARKAAPKRKAAAKRKAAPRRRAATRKAAPRRAAYRSNPRRPKMPDVVDTLMTGGVRATQILVGEAVTRAVPQAAGLPIAGPMGLAVQAGVAIVAGYVATMFLSRDAAAAITAGGLSAPIRTFIISQKVPFIADALSPVATQAAIGAYVQPRRLPRRTPTSKATALGKYVPPQLTPSSVVGAMA